MLRFVVRCVYALCVLCVVLCVCVCVWKACKINILEDVCTVYVHSIYMTEKEKEKD